MAFVRWVETSVIISSIMFDQEIFLHLWNSFILNCYWHGDFTRPHTHIQERQSFVDAFHPGPGLSNDTD